MIEEPQSARSSRPVTQSPHDELARAKARIRDLEAALDVANRRAESQGQTGIAQALARSEARFRQLIDQLHVGVVVQGPRSEILAYNARALDLLGLTEDEIHGRTSFDPSWQVVREDGSPYLPEERPVSVVLTTHTPVRGAIMGIKRPRTRDQIWLLVNALPELDADGEIVQVVSTLDDVSEYRRIDRELRELEKLDSLGLLAGGIAHDFNNLLTVIGGCAQLARAQLEPDAPATEDLDELLTATERAQVLTRQLLSFARRSPGDPERLDLNAAVGQFEKLLRRLLPSEHELVVEREPDPVLVKIDRGQLEQILVNLVVNARDAMAEGGRVIVSIGRVGPGHAPAPLDERAAAVLGVGDQGCGIAQELLERVFEPLFTTKAVGQGTGLGLATVRGLVREANGRIHIVSEVGRGTQFCVYLPLIAELDRAPSRLISGIGAGETVLIVEDDDVLRAVTARMLGELGYRTLEARDGVEALALLEQRGDAIDLVFTDLIMPRMGGIELVLRINEDWPSLRVVVSSGHIDEHADEVTSHADALLAKPFNMARLGRVVRQVLDS